MKKIPFFTFIILFLAITAGSILKPDTTYSENENRTLAKMPVFTFASFVSGDFTKQYETYVDDQFIGRDGWINLKTNIELAIGKDVINNVYIGKDDYLIEQKNESDIDWEQAERNAQRLVEFIKTYRDTLGEKRVYAMLVPSSSYVLSEKLPNYAYTYTGDDYLEEIKSELGDSFIDCRDELLSHKDEYIYYRTDHHWTTHGAYYAYSAWAEKIGARAFQKENFQITTVSRDFFGTLSSKINLEKVADTIPAYLTNNEYTVTYNYNYDMDGKPFSPQDSLYDYDMLETKDKYSFFLRGNNALVEIDKQIQPEATNERTLLIIKDSYAHCFAPFTTMHFDKVYMADLRYLNEPLSDFIENNNVTDVLVLYNVLQFIDDTNSSKLLK